MTYKLRELHENWANYFGERKAAEEALDKEFKKEQDAINKAQKELSARKAKAQKQFIKDWNAEKERRRFERDEAIIAALMDGATQASLMKDLGTSNTILFSQLAKEAQRRLNEGIKTGTDNVAVSTPRVPSEAWRYSNHTGVHGWLISADGTRYKMYDPYFDPETDEGDPEFFIGDLDGRGFVEGSKELYLRTPPKVIEKRLEMLQALLEGTYKGRISESDNPYTD
ncbi:MAG: hypothetical protein ACTHJ9_14480 [Rhodanobacter sp.]